MKQYRRHYEGKTVLVTGGAGAIGSNLTTALVDIGSDVVVLDDLRAGQLWTLPSEENLLFVEGRVQDETDLKRVFFEKPDIVFHLAAFFANQNSVDYPERDLEVNGFGTLRTLQYATMNQAERFVYASSGCSIYGSRAPLPLTEDFISLNLSSPYQITKMLGECYCNFFHHHHGLEIAKPRFFNSYGPGEVPGQYRNVIPNFIYWALQGRPLPITGSGKETRDFTYVDDIVDGLLRAGVEEEANGEAFNLASGEETRIEDLASLINDLTDNEAGIVFAERRQWDTKDRLRASVDKASDLIGYSPTTDLREGLTKTIDWFRTHWDRIDAAASFGPGASSAVREIVPRD